ncbi:hypothetical protein P5915_08075 [Acholeplasma manati]|nr:hypothetical protein [Paracholeplasma manati]
MKVDKDSDKMALSRQSRIERERKNFILKRYLSGILLTTVAAVASFRLFQPVVIQLLSLYNTADTLNYEFYIEHHPDLKMDTLRITLESPEEYYEQPMGVGDQMGVFSTLIVGREYTLKIKGDFGFGDQTVYETKYRLTTKPVATISISQNIHTLYYYLNVTDIYDILPTEQVILNVYEWGELFQSVEITLDPSGNTQSYGEINEVKADGHTYHFELVYPERGGYQTLLESDFTTTNDPMIYGSAYIDLENVSYYFYLYDFALKRLIDDIRITLYLDGVKVYQDTFTLDETLSIEGIIENVDPTKVYEIKVAIYLEKGFTDIYQSYVYQWEEHYNETQ